MVELNLRRTWTEIFEYLNSSPNPLRLVELINRVPPCSWTFKFTFDGNGRITVRINCDCSVSNNDALALFDGTLEEIFFADTIFLCQTEKYVSADIAGLISSPPSLNIIRFRSLNVDANFLLTLKGYWRSNSTPSDIQKESVVRSYFLENTWLGSEDFAESDYYIRWSVFASEYMICPGDRYENKLSTTDFFTSKMNLYNPNGECIGYANFRTSPLLKKDEVYTIFGPLNPKPRKSKNWLFKNRSNLNWIVEIGSNTLKKVEVQGEYRTKHINELVDSIENTQILVIESDNFQNMIKESSGLGKQKKRKV